jgi:7-cyano-7-deazaguanine synthase
MHDMELAYLNQNLQSRKYTENFEPEKRSYMNKSAVVLFSGGLDSTVCLFWAKRNFEDVAAVAMNYGQSNIIELISAVKIADRAGVPFEVVPVVGVLHGTSPLINEEAKVQQYDDVESLPKGLENTFVPARNPLFLVIAANRAYCRNAHHVVTGVSQAGPGGYPDCGQLFIYDFERAMRSALRESTGDPAAFNFCLEAPLLYKDKKATIELAQELGEECMNALAYSHTCHTGTVPPCHKCRACLLRAKGFKLAGIPDPLLVRLGVTA